MAFYLCKSNLYHYTCRSDRAALSPFMGLATQALSGTLLRQRITMSFRSSFGITSNFRRIVSLLILAT